MLQVRELKKAGASAGYFDVWCEAGGLMGADWNQGGFRRAI